MRIARFFSVRIPSAKSLAAKLQVWLTVCMDGRVCMLGETTHILFVWMYCITFVFWTRVKRYNVPGRAERRQRFYVHNYKNNGEAKNQKLFFFFPHFFFLSLSSVLFLTDLTIWMSDKPIRAIHVQVYVGVRYACVCVCACGCLQQDLSRPLNRVEVAPWIEPEGGPCMFDSMIEFMYSAINRASVSLLSVFSKT